MAQSQNTPPTKPEVTNNVEFLPVTILAVLLFLLVPFERLTHIHPIYLCITIFFILYPFRNKRGVSQLFILAIAIALIAFWLEFMALLMPFVISFFLAFFLDPLMRKIESYSIPRWVVMLVFFLLVLGGVTLIGFFLIPQIVAESRILFNNLPTWISSMITSAESNLMPLISKFQKWNPGAIPTDAATNITQYTQKVVGWLTAWSSSALQGAGSLLTGIANVALVPIITAYLLTDFRKIKGGVYDFIPEQYRGAASDAFNQLNIVLSAYVRGQLIVVLFLATWISLGLTLFTNIPYSILIGTTAGILNLVPYIGPLVALILAIIIAAFQSNPLITITIVLAVFISAQALEGNLLTPRIVGTKVGLGELEVIFLMLLFATMLGLVGMLIAIPVGAGAKVLFKVYREHRTVNSV
ncbi:AI-2E family transporter [Calditrichota bacterium]